jgi:hypothetical protein
MKEVQVIVGVVAIALGGIGGMLAILDWTLSKRSKRWIEDKASTLCIWMSYQQTLPLLRKLQDRRAFAIFIALGTTVFVSATSIFAVLIFMWLVPSQHRFSSLGALSLVVAGSYIIILGPPLFALYLVRNWLRRGYVWITSGPRGTTIFLRIVGALLALVVIDLVINAVVPDPEPIALVKHFSVESHPTLAIIAGIALLVLYPMYLGLAFILLAIITLSLYVFAIYALIGLFRATQTLILRCVENEKGVVLGIAALVAGLGALLKSLAP